MDRWIWVWGCKAFVLWFVSLYPLAAYMSWRAATGQRPGRIATLFAVWLIAGIIAFVAFVVGMGLYVVWLYWDAPR
jgi:hypothetical protein